MRLPKGWTGKVYSTWIGGSRVSSRVYKHAGESLEVRRKMFPAFRVPQWTLEHNGQEGSHAFATATEAIEHAEDVIHHAG